MISATADPLPPPDVPFEVVDGKFVEKATNVRATFVALGLADHLVKWLCGCGLGVAVPGMLCAFSENLRRRPSVAFVSAERWPLDREIPDEGDWEVIPDLAGEIASPKDTAEALHAKVVEYFAHGVRQVWVVLPRTRQVCVYDAADAVRIVVAPNELEPALLPGWRMPLSVIFRNTVIG